MIPAHEVDAPILESGWPENSPWNSFFVSICHASFSLYLSLYKFILLLSEGHLINDKLQSALPSTHSQALSVPL